MSFEAGTNAARGSDEERYPQASGSTGESKEEGEKIQGELERTRRREGSSETRRGKDGENVRDISASRSAMMET